MRTILIDVNRRTVRELDITGKLDSIQHAIDPGGCYIEIGLRLEAGHVLFVDEEGLFKPTRGFFRLAGIERPYAGNGLIVGPEIYDNDGEYIRTEDVSLPVHTVARAVSFLSRAQADAWAKANASEPEIYIRHDDGSVEVIAYRGQVWRDMPPVEEE